MERKYIAIGFSGAVGLLASELWWRSGFATTIHELGHCLTGLSLYRYLPGQGPAMEVGQLLRLEAFISEPSWTHLRTYLKAAENLNEGCAWVHHGIPRFGLSFDARRSIVAISGSVPQLVLDGSVVGVGVAVDDDVVTASCVGFAVLNHIKNSIYPFKGWQLLRRGLPAWEGHDFVNFAKHLSKITGVAPVSIAGATFTLWAGSVPSIALGHLVKAVAPVKRRDSVGE